MKYYAVIDLEMCRVGRQTGYPYRSEIIQIGAVLMNEQFEILDRFDQYVRPEYGRIDRMIEKLTGIKNAHVNNANIFSNVLQDFLQWLPKEEVILVTWSNSDEKQLRVEAESKSISLGRLTDLFETARDCQQMFSERMGTHRLYRLEEALVASDIILDGRAHNGLVDAENTALLFKKLVIEPNFKLNAYYETAHSTEKADVLSFSMGDLINSFNWQESLSA